MLVAVQSPISHYSMRKCSSKHKKCQLLACILEIDEDQALSMNPHSANMMTPLISSYSVVDHSDIESGLPTHTTASWVLSSFWPCPLPLQSYHWSNLNSSVQLIKNLSQNMRIKRSKFIHQFIINPHYHLCTLSLRHFVYSYFFHMFHSLQFNILFRFQLHPLKIDIYLKMKTLLSYAVQLMGFFFLIEIASLTMLFIYRIFLQNILQSALMPNSETSQANAGGTNLLVESIPHSCFFGLCCILFSPPPADEVIRE